MLDSKLRCPLGLDISELMKIVPESIHASTIKPSPKGGFAHRHTAHPSERRVVVSRPRYHVDVRVDIVHGSPVFGQSERAITGETQSKG